ncbi:Uncharacterised protein [Yersinia pseudotuberculosis]|nr:Uncharacterised protein [Yersinia pseudotuberculosis]CND30327.1 Uncharacterised protein [Yersinia pseudotuberculosis]SUP94384.1 Uncharacterised protein [Yersinia pseudotuberculosis]
MINQLELRHIELLQHTIGVTQKPLKVVLCPYLAFQNQRNAVATTTTYMLRCVNHLRLVMSLITIPTVTTLSSVVISAKCCPVSNWMYGK